MKLGRFTPCSTCSKPVWVYPSREYINLHYCGRQCQSVGKITYQKVSTISQVRKILLTCHGCGIECVVHGYRKNTFRFCSRSCHDKHRSTGNQSNNWKGGVTPVHRLLRASIKMKIWRQKVFKRDNFTCQECGATGVLLNADHIKPFAKFPRLRFSVKNGRTLCVPCHRKTSTFGARIHKHI